MSSTTIDHQAAARAVRLARRDVSARFENDALGDEHRDELVQALPEWVTARKGWLYLARNASWPTLLKIGCTRKGVPQRMQALSGSSVLTPWVPETVWAVYDAHGLEAAAHAACAQWHRRAELFEGPQTHLGQAIRRALLKDKAALLKHLAPILLPGELNHLLGLEQVRTIAPS